MVQNLIGKNLEITESLITFWKWYSKPKSFVNFLLPPQGIGEGWGGVKNLRLLQGLLYCTRLRCPVQSIGFQYKIELSKCKNTFVQFAITSTIQN